MIEGFILGIFAGLIARKIILTIPGYRCFLYGHRSPIKGVIGTTIISYKCVKCGKNIIEKGKE